MGIGWYRLNRLRLCTARVPGHLYPRVGLRAVDTGRHRAFLSKAAARRQ